MKVRVRFAPSPTGFLHIGGARTADVQKTGWTGSKTYPYFHRRCDDALVFSRMQVWGQRKSRIFKWRRRQRHIGGVFSEFQSHQGQTPRRSSRALSTAQRAANRGVGTPAFWARRNGSKNRLSSSSGSPRSKSISVEAL